MIGGYCQLHASRIAITEYSGSESVAISAQKDFSAFSGAIDNIAVAWLEFHINKFPTKHLLVPCRAAIGCFENADGRSSDQYVIVGWIDEKSVDHASFEDGVADGCWIPCDTTIC